MIPPTVQIKNAELPDCPGVYFYYDRDNGLLYVGKATSLKKRVGSYFARSQEDRIAEMVRQIARINYVETPTVLEALVLEANQIKALRPKYNILQRDDKSFLFLAITNETYPRPLLLRGVELASLGVDPFAKRLSPGSRKKFLAVFGPYTSGPSLRRALAYVRRIIPWSTCRPPEEKKGGRACFDVHLKKCPGVCTGTISPSDYHKIIRHLLLFFEGKKTFLIRSLKREMEAAARVQNFEEAARLRKTIFSLEHIRDVALLRKEDMELSYLPTREEGVNLNGRMEAYDISTISGTSAVGSMVVFEDGRPVKSAYRKFRIKAVKGSNDVAMMEEVLQRRLAHSMHSGEGWPLPVLFVIDGGEGQVNRIQRLVRERGFSIPIMGIAKGFDRKQDRLVFDRKNPELVSAASRGKELFQRARDEAHRFAVQYHRQLRSKQSLGR